MNGLYLIATIAGDDVAVPAEGIESVIKVQDVVPVPASAAHVAGLCALRSRVLTLIDCQYFITGQTLDLTAMDTAIVARIDGHSYGFLVDSVSDVLSADTPPRTVSAPFGKGWRDIASAILEVGEHSHLVIEPEAVLLAGSRLLAA